MLGADQPRYAGYVSWRGVTPAGSVPAPAGMSEAVGRGKRFGLAPAGSDQLYWFAVANTPAGGRDGDAHRELLERFGSWHAPIPAVIAATPADHIVRTDIVDRPPVTRWHAGRAVLLGDAAHPMTPNLAQGACQAIEDAAALADALAAVTGPRGTQDAAIEAALQRYESQRVARANALVVASRRFGSIGQWEHPVAATVRDWVLRLTPPSFQLRQMRRLLQPHV
jgi:2-polyprenyl-6-methoxyphenol hydroxylase-like FAD-dependent oxidoreductase